MEAGPTRGRILVPLGLATVMLFALNLAGVLRYPGGPLRYVDAGPLWLELRAPDEIGSGVLGRRETGIGVGDGLLASIFIPHDVPWEATVERVELVGSTPGLELVDAWIANGDVDGPRPGLMPADPATLAEIELAYRPLPAELAPGGTADDGVIVLELRALAAGSLEYPAVAVDYRIGPFTFRALHGPSLRLCIGPFEDWQVCDWDEEEAAFLRRWPAHYWG